MTPPSHRPQRRVLVADDDPIVLDLIERALAKAGFDTYSASCGEQAMEVVASNDIDLAILDFRMPGLTGLEVGQAMYRLTARRFLLMSVSSDKDVIEKAAAEGALGFLCKPISIKELVAQTTIAMERSAEYDHLTSSMNEMKSSHDAAIAQAVASARSVNTAIGIMMERTRQSRDEIQKMLIAQARRERRRLVEVSEEIIQQREKSYQSGPAANLARNAGKDA